MRDTLVNFVKIIDSASDYVSWIKISEQVHNLDHDILRGAVYVPPQQSRFFTDDEFDMFEQEIASADD